MDASERKSVDLGLKQNIRDDASTLLRESLYDALLHYFNNLKISSDDPLFSTSMSYVEKISVRELQVQPNFLEAVRVIVQAAREIGYIFDHSELSDILTIAVGELRKDRREEEKSLQTFDQVVFNIYKDLNENYQSFNDFLKESYPEILVNVISVIHSGKDASGVRIDSYNAEAYYRTRKDQQDVAQSFNLDFSKVEVSQVRKPVAGRVISDQRLVDSLAQITGRTTESVRDALQGLSEYDLNSIKDLCSNYNKLQKYYDIAGDEREFKEIAERELGRKLLDSQVQHAILSVRRSKIYIENILDDKFVPDKSHGINHVKHNLEYGYQLIGIIQSKRKRKNRRAD
ncbi:MAG: hypothetical protein WBL44_16700 [Nitrososphaeraceae archaeon]|jgi:hypothetical protein